MTNRITEYSQPVSGNPANYELTARFDMTDGYLGISQWVGAEIKDVERVLLSPAQVKALLKFLRSQSETEGKQT